MSRHLVDSHLHTWELAQHPQPWIDPRTMAAIDHDYPPAAAAAPCLHRMGIALR